MDIKSNEAQDLIADVSMSLEQIKELSLLLCEKECPYNALLILIYDIIQNAIIKLEKFNTFK